ncbi:hypothetical protein SGRA_3631 [Saprospira grandis str. Lewin]|uniref:Uncharacterized protein n=1 Tax=Saprospira grandis (strain Lewin) TaxID=984262 RepID=H6L5V5_SAPGL|nr:hypothetical protein SGRA_3631 [Saprospira grandis str. Lewin]
MARFNFTDRLQIGVELVDGIFVDKKELATVGIADKLFGALAFG